MKVFKIVCCGLTAAFILSISSILALADTESGKSVYRWTQNEPGSPICMDENGSLVCSSWVSLGSESAVSNEVDSGRTVSGEGGEESWTIWYYCGASGAPAIGRRSIGENYYFFDENGEMLSGWIAYESGTAEKFTGILDDTAGDIYYCNSDGAMVRSAWMQLEGPDMDGGQLEDALDLSGTLHWYYFDSKGRLERDDKISIGGKEYCFGENGRMLTGWAFKNTEGGPDDSSETHWVDINEDTTKEDIDDYRANTKGKYVSNFRFCDETTGAVVKDNWVTVMPYNEAALDDPEKKKYRFDKNGELIAAKDDPGKTGTRIAKVKDNGAYELKEYDTPAVFKEIDGKIYAFGKDANPINGLIYVIKGGSRLKKGFYCLNDGNAVKTGEVNLTSDEEGKQYTYYFAEAAGSGLSKGQAYSGVSRGRLYYQGLAVQADEDEAYQIVFVEALKKKSKDTGMFIVDRKGKVKKGTVKLSDDYKYQIKKTGTDVYKIFRIDDEKNKVEITAEMVKDEDSDGSDRDGSGVYRYVGEFEVDEWR